MEQHKLYAIENNGQLESLIRQAKTLHYSWTGKQGGKYVLFDIANKLMWWNDKIDENQTCLIYNVDDMEIGIADNRYLVQFVKSKEKGELFVKVTETTSKILQEFAFENKFHWPFPESPSPVAKFLSKTGLCFNKEKKEITWLYKDDEEKNWSTLEEAFNFIEKENAPHLETCEDFILNFTDKTIHKKGIEDGITFEEAIKIFRNVSGPVLKPIGEYAYEVKMYGKINSIDIGCIKNIPMSTLTEIYHKLRLPDGTHISTLD